MKIRQDFVTNSSSSSFIISIKDIDYDFLVNVVLKDFYVELKKNWFNDLTEEEILSWYKPEEILNDENGNVGLFVKTKNEIDNDDYYTPWSCEEESKEDLEEYYVIDNNCTCRFNWDIVEKIFTDKYKIPWKYGYCD